LPDEAVLRSAGAHGAPTVSAASPVNIWQPSVLFPCSANQLENPARTHCGQSKQWGKNMIGNGEAILENVRRYRAIASLYRQTAAFRPLQKWSLLDQAEEWEHLAVAELESYFNFGERLKMPFTNSAAITIGTG
jgi:hypothetical protein